jgi:hypothetical protein
LTCNEPSSSPISSRKTAAHGGQTSSQPARSLTAPVKPLAIAPAEAVDEIARDARGFDDDGRLALRKEHPLKAGQFVKFLEPEWTRLPGANEKAQHPAPLKARGLAESVRQDQFGQVPLEMPLGVGPRPLEQFG